VQIGPGTRVLVTGASRGIGRAIAEAFAARGCTLGLAARSEDELRGLAQELPGGPHEALPADVGEPGSLSGAIERFGDCDVLVANAGVARYQLFQEMDVETVERMTRINWLGTVYAVKAALPRMLQRRHGQVVVVSSGAGYRSFPQAAVYGATKAAQRAFAEALRHDLAGTGVSVTVVYPGEIKTHLHDHEKAEMPDWYQGYDKAASPEPLAAAVVRGVERDERAVHYPPIVRVLRIVHGISPQAGDALLRRLRGSSAAPRRD
jgi:short-subunit dehydrogenase